MNSYCFVRDLIWIRGYSYWAWGLVLWNTYWTLMNSYKSLISSVHAAHLEWWGSCPDSLCVRGVDLHQMWSVRETLTYPNSKSKLWHVRVSLTSADGQAYFALSSVITWLHPLRTLWAPPLNSRCFPECHAQLIDLPPTGFKFNPDIHMQQGTIGLLLCTYSWQRLTPQQYHLWPSLSSMIAMWSIPLHEKDTVPDSAVLLKDKCVRRGNSFFFLYRGRGLQNISLPTVP